MRCPDCGYEGIGPQIERHTGERKQATTNEPSELRSRLSGPIDSLESRRKSRRVMRRLSTALIVIAILLVI